MKIRSNLVTLSAPLPFLRAPVPEALGPAPRSLRQRMASRLRQHPMAALNAALLLVDAIWMAAGGWTMSAGGLITRGGFVLALLALLAVPRYGADARISGLLRTMAALVTFTIVGGVLSYLVVSTSAPLIDDVLVQADAWLGFDWPAARQWLSVQPTLQGMAQFAYASGLPQIAVVVVALSLRGQHGQLAEFMHLFVAACLVSIALSACWPAAGPWAHLGPDSTVDRSAMSHFAPLRAGTMRHIDLAQMQGLIAIPSMHAAMAVLLTWALRAAGPWLLGPAAGLNLAMIMATPVQGGHYLVDVLAGIVLAAILIVLYRRGWARRRACAGQ